MIAFDTNVFVYTADTSAGERHRRSSELLAAALARGRLFLPLQVMTEYYSVVTRKLAMNPEVARGDVETYTAAARVAPPYDLTDLRAAIGAARGHNVPVWDALVWAVCERHGVGTLVTEDFQDGRTLGRVTFVDPFNPANAARLALNGQG